MKKTLFSMLAGCLFACCAAFCAELGEFDDFGDFESDYQQTNQISDPFYRANYAVFKLNVALFNMSVRPLAASYKALTFPIMRRGVSNFFENLSAPFRAITLLISGRAKDGARTLGGFVINSTFGLGGVAAIAPQGPKSDFGLAAARWGIGTGPHLHLPGLGPSNLRDAAFKPLDFALNPASWLPPVTTLSLRGADTIQTISKYQPLIDEGLKSVNSYALLKQWYEQGRKDNE